MPISLTTPDDNDDTSAMRAADEALGFCAAFAMHDNSMLALIKETQRRLRRRMHPEMFTEDGKYR